MRGWVKAEEVTPGKWWQLRDGTLRRRDIVGEYISFARECDLFWKRGGPLPDDPRWLPPSAAIAEWGKQGGSKGWWFNDTPNTGAIGRWTGRLTVVHFGMFIPRGKPPVPNALEQSPRSEKGPQEWTPEQVKAFNELKPGPIKPFDTGVRMATYAVIPLETHRKRLEEFAEFVKVEYLMFHEKQTFQNAINTELARLLEEAKA